jgi:hypothetical protein
MNKEQLKKEDELFKAQFNLVQKNAEFVWSKLDTEIEKPKSIIKFKGEDLIFDNSIVLIQGKEGSHKSRLASALTSLFLSKSTDLNLMEFSKTEDVNYSVIYLDTERNKQNQLPAMLKQIKSTLQISKDELQKRLIIGPLAETDRRSRTFLMGKLFEESKHAISESAVIILDIVTDFVADFNNLTNSFALLDLLNQASGKRNITFIVIIHENPGSADKARGHLGTELANKASTIITINAKDKGSDIYKVLVKKSRNTKSGAFAYYKFNEVTEKLELLGDSDLLKNNINLELDKVVEFLSMYAFTVKTKKALYAEIQEKLKFKERKIDGLLKQIIDSKTPIDILGKSNYLEKERTNNTNFKLVEFEEVLTN